MDITRAFSFLKSIENKACRRYRFHATHLNSQCYCTCTTSSAAHRRCEFPDHRGNTSTVTPSFVKEERGRLCRVQGDLFGGSKGDVGQETACCSFRINPGKIYQAIKLSNSPSYALHVRYEENQQLNSNKGQSINYVYYLGHFLNPSLNPYLLSNKDLISK